MSIDKAAYPKHKNINQGDPAAVPLSSFTYMADAMKNVQFYIIKRELEKPMLLWQKNARCKI